MAICSMCSKKRQMGGIVSHSNIKTKHWNLPNLQRVKAMIDGRPKFIYVCTRCLRSGLITKAP